MVAARNFPEWYAFFGGEEMNVSRDDAATIWAAATKAADARQTQTNSASDAICHHCCDVAMRDIYEQRKYVFCPMCGGKLRTLP